jgi:hypothetical protein
VDSGRQRNKENNIKQSEWWEGKKKKKKGRKKKAEAMTPPALNTSYKFKKKKNSWGSRLHVALPLDEKKKILVGAVAPPGLHVALPLDEMKILPLYQ